MKKLHETYIFTHSYVHTYIIITNQNVTFIDLLIITIQRQDLFLYGMAHCGQVWSDKSKIAMCC